MPLIPADYEERVYAGVLGKIVGVYLGRPVEGWSYDKITAMVGEIDYYLNDRTDLPLNNHQLVVADDDISGTLIFPRALRDTGLAATSATIGDAWLNYIVESRSVLWWGGMGNSTEHTAYLRMRAGVRPPDSGSIARNGPIAAEQVGAEIFVEGFALTCPGDPQTAADLAEQAARVSHDGEAIHAARVVAALVSQAFVEPDLERLLDGATDLIPANCLIRRVIDDVRAWAADHDDDWRATRQRIDDRYGYHQYPGNCHIVPCHATVIAALAHSGGDFGRAVTIATALGGDTDSNAGNVGAICGVLGGLSGLGADRDGGRDWRGPIADRLYLPSADGGAAITDAAREALALAALGRQRSHSARAPEPLPRFQFTLPGSIRGFAGGPLVHNSGGRLAITEAGTVVTPTFIPPDARTDVWPYDLIACPTLYPGQTIRARISGPAQVRLVIQTYDGNDELRTIVGPAPLTQPTTDLTWTVPDLGGQPVAFVGVRTAGPAALHHLTWDGAPTITLTRPPDGGTMWRRAWVSAVDHFEPHWPEPFRIAQNRGTGLLITGTRQWRDYEVTADIRPYLADLAGLAARVQGLRRYYAVELVAGNRVRLVRGDTVLAERDYPWRVGDTHRLSLLVAGTRLRARVDDKTLFDIDDARRGGALDCGGVALLVAEGCTATHAVHISPAAASPAASEAS